MAKPGLHSEFTKDPPGTGLGCFTKSWGNMSRKSSNNPTTEEEHRQLYLFGVPQGSRHRHGISGEGRHEQSTLGSPEDPQLPIAVSVGAGSLLLDLRT